MKRKDALVTGEIYHVFNKSIAHYKIFNDEQDFLRITQMIRYYRANKTPLPFSAFLRTAEVAVKGMDLSIQECLDQKDNLVQLVGYCIMPTHLHFILKQSKENGITKFVGNLLNSYSRYFNTRHGRRGPLWVGPFKNVRVETNEQLLHLTRYVHLNPVTASLVGNPHEWAAHSYHEYISEQTSPALCDFKDLVNIVGKGYQTFVEEHIDHQKRLAKIKHLLFD